MIFASSLARSSHDGSHAGPATPRSYGQGHLALSRPGFAGVDVTSGFWRRQLLRRLLDLVEARVSSSPLLTWDWSGKPRSKPRSMPLGLGVFMILRRLSSSRGSAHRMAAARRLTAPRRTGSFTPSYVSALVLFRLATRRLAARWFVAPRWLARLASDPTPTSAPRGPAVPRWIAAGSQLHVSPLALGASGFTVVWRVWRLACSLQMPPAVARSSQRRGSSQAGLLSQASSQL